MQNFLTALLALLALIGITAPALIVGSISTPNGMATSVAVALVAVQAIGLVSAGVVIFRLK